MPEKEPPREYVNAKFIQISVADDAIYALDVYGSVWRFDPAHMGALATWTRLPNHRTF